MYDSFFKFTYKNFFFILGCIYIYMESWKIYYWFRKRFIFQIDFPKPAYISPLSSQKAPNPPQIQNGGSRRFYLKFSSCASVFPALIYPVAYVDVLCRSAWELRRPTICFLMRLLTLRWVLFLRDNSGAGGKGAVNIPELFPGIF